jgi:hypothetical protein
VVVFVVLGNGAEGLTQPPPKTIAVPVDDVDDTIIGDALTLTTAKLL